MRVVFMGTPQYVMPVLDALVSMKLDVEAVYTQPDKPAGRGRPSQPPPAKLYAQELGSRVVQPSSLKSTEAQTDLGSVGPDLIVVAAYGKILPAEVLKIPKYGCLNVHPSLLPQYRGPSPVVTAVLNGDAYTGTTIMLLDEGMDSGMILSGRDVSIGAGASTAESLTPLLFQVGAELLKETIPGWVNGDIEPKPQDHSKATYTKKLERVDGQVDWEISAQNLERRLRAFTPWPGLFTHWQGRILKLIAVTPIEAGHGGATGPRDPVGLVVPLDENDSCVGIVTGRGVLALNIVQIEGKRPVSSEEFARGYPAFVGSRIPS